jgi:hypothetical protein
LELEKRKDSPICRFGELLEIMGSQTVRSGTDIELKHPSTSVGLGKWDVDTLLESGLSVVFAYQGVIVD